LVRLMIYGTCVALVIIVSRVYRGAPADLKERWPAVSSPKSLVAVALLVGLFVDVFGYSYHSGLPTNKLAVTYRQPPMVYWVFNDRAAASYQAGGVRRLNWQAERLGTPREARQQLVLGAPSYYHTYAFAQFDPCEPSIPLTIISTSMAKLLALRDKGDKALRTILGCEAPKMRLLTKAVYVEDEKQAAAAVQNVQDLAGTAILESSRPPEPSSATKEIPGSVAVTRFGANALTATVHVDNPDGAWLVYADAYDPRWRASINGQTTPVVPAYVGLKAVRVPGGDSVVRMEFSGAATAVMTVLAMTGAICSLSLLGYCAICCVVGFPSSDRSSSKPGFVDVYEPPTPATMS